MLLIGFSSCDQLTVLTIQVQFRNFQYEANFYREQHFNEQKRILKARVEEAVDYTLRNSRTPQERLKQDIKGI